MTRKHTRARKFLAKLLLVVLGFAMGGVVAELALRVSGYSYPEFYQRDEVLGVSLLPGAEGWYRKEGEAYVRINSDGRAIVSMVWRSLKGLSESQSLVIPIVRRFQSPRKKPFGLSWKSSSSSVMSSPAGELK